VNKCGRSFEFVIAKAFLAKIAGIRAEFA